MTGLIVVILRSIRVDDLFLFMSWWDLGMEWGCWVRVIVVCYFMFDCDFLGCICLIRVLWSRECCDFERFVRFG